MLSSKRDPDVYADGEREAPNSVSRTLSLYDTNINVIIITVLSCITTIVLSIQPGLWLGGGGVNSFSH